MKICIAGAGAIGGIIATRLASAGHTVCVIARGAHLSAIRRDGLTLVDHLNHGQRTAFHLEADADPSALAERMGEQDLIFLATKANGLHQLLHKIGPLLHRGSLVIPAINGLPWWYFMHEGGPYDGRSVEAVDPGGDLLKAIDSKHLVGCVVHLAGEVRAPGEVHHTGGKRLIFGEIDRRLPDTVSSRVKELTDLLQKAGFDAAPTPNIRSEVWIKLIGNLSFNPVAALSGALMDAIIDDPGLVSVLIPMLQEGTAVARALGIEISMTPEERIELAKQLGSAKISMLQDFEAGRAPELNAIVASVIELGGWTGVPVPTVQLVYALAFARATHLGLFAV